MKKLIGQAFVVLSFPAWFLAFIGAISGSYGVETSWDKFVDAAMRVLFVGTPFGLLISGIGLLKQRKWGSFLGILVSAILLFATFSYGIAGLGDKGNAIFCAVCFGLGIFFLSALIYLSKTFKGLANTKGHQSKAG